MNDDYLNYGDEDYDDEDDNDYYGDYYSQEDDEDDMYEDDLNQQPNPPATSASRDLTINVEISEIIRNNEIGEVTEEHKKEKKEEVP